MASAHPAKSSRDEILQFLDDLDNLGPTAANATPETAASKGDDPAAQDALDFLDQMTKRSSTPVPPAPAPRVSSDLKRPTSRSSMRSFRASTPQTRDSPGRPSSPAPAPRAPSPAAPAPAAAEPASNAWGWSSVWNSATSVIQQAKEVADHNLSPLAPNLQSQQEQAKKWTGSVLGSIVSSVGQMDLEQVKSKGLKAVTDIINAVAPPISEHEVIQVWLSHDMLGYEGVETLVYRALTKVMEQVEGGELHVNKGSTDQPSATSVNDEDRNLNAVEGWEVGHKMAQVEMDALLARHPPADAQSSSSGKSKANPDLPITICPVYLRIQPVLAPLPWHTEATTKPAAGRALFFLFHFRDPLHGLTHETLTQALPASWLDIPFEENEWVENEMVDVIRKGVELVGQDYVRTRQHGRAQAAAQARAALQGQQAGREPVAAAGAEP